MRAAAVLAAMLAVPGSWQGSPPLPERESFLREARETLARSQQAWHQYAYKERRTDVHVNPFGRMGTGDTRLLEVRPSPNPQLTYRRVIERNGAPVPKHELDRQDAEYRARVAQVEQRRGTDGDADERDARARDELLARRRAQLVINDVLNTLHFDVVRRDTRHGRPAVVVSFAARPDARPTTRQGRIARVFKGNAWIDEVSKEVTHVEALAIDDVSFGGFIAKLYQGTRAEVRRQEIEPGVWMPTHVKLSGDVRALFRRARIDYVVEWFDYQRLPPVPTPTPPGQGQQAGVN
jgi:hypothetical protein